MKRNPKLIEQINASGPFNHSIWRGKNLVVTNEEGLAGRARFLADTIRKSILRVFPKTRLRDVTIADVGCYDGWILHMLEDFPFRDMVGIEPRQKNIDKGRKIRTLLGIKSRVRFVNAAIESLPKKKYDIVLCIGTFHHLESVPTALRSLDAICGKLLIIETLCLPREHITPGVRQDVEMKDVIYKFKPTLCGLTGQKFEPSYYDGSAMQTGVVSIPSIPSLLMYLDVLGYDAVIAAKPEDFKRAMPRNPRPSQEVLIYAVKKKKLPEDAELRMYVTRYERGFIEEVLPRDIVVPLYERYCRGRKIRLSGAARLVARHLEDPARPLGGLERRLIKRPAAMEIVRTLRFNQFEKISFEYGKILLSEKNFREAAVVLQSIVQKVNADWRATYRALYLLSEIYRVLEDRKQNLYYRGLCVRANPNFAKIMYSHS